MPVATERGTIRDWILTLSALSGLDKSDVELILRAESNGSMMIEMTGTRVDDKLTLLQSALSHNRDKLWDIRVILAYAQHIKENQDDTRWIGARFLTSLGCQIDQRRRETRL